MSGPSASREGGEEGALVGMPESENPDSTSDDESMAIAIALYSQGGLGRMELMKKCQGDGKLGDAVFATSVRRLSGATVRFSPSPGKLNNLKIQRDIDREYDALP
jgi:hypothetical protein